MSKWLWTQIWDISEFTGISLGRLAPYVFSKMIGVKGERVDDELLFGSDTPSKILEDVWFAARRGDADMRPFESRIKKYGIQERIDEVERLREHAPDLMIAYDYDDVRIAELIALIDKQDEQ
jgi:hypothetical protein